VIGADLHKDEAVLNDAYNTDEACRNFFVHMIRRINEHMGADFDPLVFKLSSVYQEEASHEAFRTWRMSLRVSPVERQHTWIRSLGIEDWTRFFALFYDPNCFLLRHCLFSRFRLNS
jgi:hypothetical protein